MKHLAFVICAASTLAFAPDAHAQQLRSQCASASRAEVRVFCENIADASAILQPRIGIVLSGGNPVPGTASTLGMRLGTLPRISLGGRVTAAHADLPAIERLTSTSDVKFPVGAISVDASVGIFSGLSVLPTVGGLGSIDLLLSAGTIPLSRGEGFDDDAPFSWAAGARLGLLRESFTAPGVSVSGMYRSIGDITYGDPALADRDAFVEINDLRVISLRATAGKRLLGFGLTAGAGYDRYTSDVSATVRDATVLQPTRVLEISESGISDSRASVFGNASFTLLILNLAAEIGWQDGAKPATGASPKLEKRGLFGGLAVRLAI